MSNRKTPITTKCVQSYAHYPLIGLFPSLSLVVNIQIHIHEYISLLTVSILSCVASLSSFLLLLHLGTRTKAGLHYSLLQY